MKKNLTFLLLVFLVIVLACNTKPAGTDSKKDSSAVSKNTEDKENQIIGVCIWDNVSLKDAPNYKGKWLASINLGEKCNYMNETKNDSVNKKAVPYFKIKLLDGKEGWVQGDFIILNSKPAVFVRDGKIYSRPDMVTNTDRSFTRMDIVAVKSTQDEFLEITGKRKAGQWIETGWVRPADVSQSSIDIAVASFAVKALAIPDEQKRKQAIREIINNSEFSTSQFIGILTEMVDSAKVQ
jgi:hypothetical protein